MRKVSSDVAETIRETMEVGIPHKSLETARATSGAESRIVDVGDMVILKSDQTSRSFWKVGKVEELIPGKDDVIRTARCVYYKRWWEKNNFETPCSTPDPVGSTITVIYYRRGRSTICSDELKTKKKGCRNVRGSEKGLLKTLLGDSIITC